LFTTRKQTGFIAQKLPHFRSIDGNHSEFAVLEERVAIGLVLLAGVIALPVAAFSWLSGYVSFGNALLIYVLTGWAVVAAGFLSSLLVHLFNGTVSGDRVEPQPVAMKVKQPNRN
jgi:hypothetical protein